MGNIVPEKYAESPVPGVGQRIDFNLTTEDAINGFFIEIESAATLAGGINMQVLHSLDKLTDAQVTAAVGGNTYYDLNDGAVGTELIGALSLVFTAQKVNRVFIKPGEIIGGVTFPDQLLPHITLRIDSTAIRITDVKITHRGVK